MIIDLEPESWLIFENSLCEHQAYRNLKRLAGLCNIYICDSYKFPCEFSDYYVGGESIFNNIQSNESNYIDEKSLILKKILII